MCAAFVMGSPVKPLDKTLIVETRVWLADLVSRSQQKKMSKAVHLTEGELVLRDTTISSASPLVVPAVTAFLMLETFDPVLLSFTKNFLVVLTLTITGYYCFTGTGEADLGFVVQPVDPDAILRIAVGYA